VLAIGGITLARVPEVARTGAAGIAAVGLFATSGELALADAIRYIKAAFA
jgi:thiamine monophosphate synthase